MATPSRPAAHTSVTKGPGSAGNAEQHLKGGWHEAGLVQAGLLKQILKGLHAADLVGD